MTRMYNDVGRDTGNDEGMTYRKIEKGRNSGKRSDSDLLGANSEIGRKLRQYYDELVSDEIPDRFSQLLKKLEQKEEPRSAAQED